MVIDGQTIITLSAILAAIIAIASHFAKGVRWFDNQNGQDDKIKALHKKHDDDMRIINEEQTLLVYGILACLKGLKEQGCNGPVTEAINKIEKHLNNKAHHQGG